MSDASNNPAAGPAASDARPAPSVSSPHEPSPGALSRQTTDPSASRRDPPRPGPEISIIIPLYNEGPNISELQVRLKQSLQALGRTWEVVLVNDGSTDQTARLLDAVAEADKRFVIIHFRRNYGQTSAIAAGIRYARGEILIPMDGDLQNDPDDIGQMLEKLAEGYDVVSGWRKKRNDPLSKVVPSYVANAMISFVTGVKLHDYGCSLKAYRRDVLKDLFLCGEMHRFIPVYATMRGARVAEIPVRHFPRVHGKSKYGLERVLKVLLDLVMVKFFLSFMTKPIYLFGGLGIFSFVCSGFAMVAAIVFKLIPKDNPWGPHWHKDFVESPLPLLACFLAALGVVMILQGLLAEVLMRTYFESQAKRPYEVRQVRNTPEEG